MLENNLGDIMTAFYCNNKRVEKIANKTVMEIRILKQMSQDKRDMIVYQNVNRALYGERTGYDSEEIEDLLRFTNMYETLGDKEIAKHIVAESEFMHHKVFYEN